MNHPSACPFTDLVTCACLVCLDFGECRGAYDEIDKTYGVCPEEGDVNCPGFEECPMGITHEIEFKE